MKHAPDSAETFLRRIQDLTVHILNARESGNTVSIDVPFDEYLAVNGRMRLDGSLRKERNVVTSAFEQLKGVAVGKFPVPIERTPDIEPFFLP